MNLAGIVTKNMVVTMATMILQSTQFLKETQKLHGTLTENISNNARLLH